MHYKDSAAAKEMCGRRGGLRPHAVSTLGGLLATEILHIKLQVCPCLTRFRFPESGSGSGGSRWVEVECVWFVARLLLCVFTADF